MMEAFKGIPTQKVHVSLTDAEGKTILDEDVEFPAGWDYNDILVVSSRYLCNSAKRKELSLFDMIERVSKRLAEWAAEVYGWNEEQKNAFAEKLAWFQVHRYFAFNSPVYFNVGLDGEELTHACFILDVEDSLESIYDWIQREMRIFRRGAGSGVNLSKLRGSVENVSGSGKASGPVSFLAVADISAAIIKSGGRLRRAAKLARLDCWHIDIEKFITAKQHQEKKARILVEEGVITDPIGEVPLQATNLSVGVTDEFMRAVVNDKEWELRGVKDDIKKVVRAKELFEKITTAAWDVGCPGLQFHDTINKYNPALRQLPDGKLENVILGSNPCLISDTWLVDGDRLIQIGDKTQLRDSGMIAINQDGEEVPVYEAKTFYVWQSGKNKKVIKLITKPGYEITLTPDHLVMLRDGTWCKAKDTLGKSIALCSIIDRQRDYAFDEEMVFFGFLFGDGFGGDDRGIAVRLDKEKESEVYDLLLRHGCYEQSVLNDRQVVMYLSKSRIPDWFQPFRQKAETKYIPKEVFHWPLPKIASFLRGLFEANGSLNKIGQVSFKTISKQLAKDIQLLLTLFGIPSWIVENKPQKIKWHNGTYTSKRSYNIQIAPRIAWKFVDLIGFHSGYKLANFRNTSGEYKTHVKVIAIEDAGYADVYDFMMKEGAPLAVANGFVVHNCSEFVSPPNTACNLASLNLLKFYDKGKFNHKLFNEAVNVLVRAMTAISYKAAYPDERIRKGTQKFHNIGIGYTNLAALLLTLGLPYDSDEAAYHVGLLTAYLQGCAIRESQKIADELGGPYPEFTPDRHKEVMSIFKEDALTLTSNEHYQDRLHIRNLVHSLWKKLDPSKPTHNAQFTLLAPTGTISFLMGAADSTGIEPFYSLVTQKRLMDGKVLTLVPKAMVAKLTEIYGESKATEIAEYIVKNGTFPSDVDPSVKRLFKCAISDDPECAVSLDGRIKVAAAAQKFLSGAISITFNLPNSATPQDVAKVYMKAWESGLKGVTIYRDGSKAIQVLYSKNKRITPKPAKRYPLPQERSGKIKKFRINSVKGYILTGEYPDGSLGEIFVKIAKEGSTLAGLFDTVALLISIALQHGVPLELIVDRLRGSRFEPAGFTGEEEIPMATSPIDYLARYLELSYLKRKEKKETFLQEGTGMFCHKCGSEMVRKGGCYVCKTCGETSGSCE